MLAFFSVILFTGVVFFLKICFADFDGCFMVPIIAMLYKLGFAG